MTIVVPGTTTITTPAAIIPVSEHENDH